jgi:hypothetical protein
VFLDPTKQNYITARFKLEPSFRPLFLRSQIRLDKIISLFKLEPSFKPLFELCLDYDEGIIAIDLI